MALTGLTRICGEADRAHRLVGDADQALVAAAAEHQPDDRNLPEHVVEAVERHEGAAQVHVVLGVVDLARDGRAHQRPAHDAVAHRHLAGKAGELGVHFGERHAAALLPGRAGDDLVEPLLAAHGEIADEQNADLRRAVVARRIHRHPHLPAADARIHVGEAEQGAGVAALDIDDAVVVARAQPQVAEQRGVAPDLGVHDEVADVPAAARELEIEAAQRLAVVADHGADLDVEIDVGLLVLGLGRACRPAATS